AGGVRVVACHAGIAGGRQRILVVQRGIAHAHQHLAGRQGIQLAADHLLTEGALLVTLGLQGLEMGHGSLLLLLWDYQKRCFCRPVSTPSSVELAAMPTRSCRLFFWAKCSR